MMSHREAGFSVMEGYHLPRKVTPLGTNYKQPAVLHMSKECAMN